MTNDSDIRVAIETLRRAMGPLDGPARLAISTDLDDSVRLEVYHEDGMEVVEGIDTVAQQLDDSLERFFDDGGFYRSMSSR